MTQKEALSIMKKGHNIFLTGSAGCGKTYLLSKYIAYLKTQNIKVAITASSGIAATHLNGITINAWSGIGLKKELSYHDMTSLLKRKYLHTRFCDTKVLIIDEISMLPISTFEMVDKVCKAFKRNRLPFGGMQVILSGDFFQLPPVCKSGEDDYVFKSRTFVALSLKVCYLNQPYRQVDKKFLNLLSQIRENNILDEAWEMLKKRFVKPPLNGITPTKLYTHNLNVDCVNNFELAKIYAKPYAYLMKERGSRDLLVLLKKSCLVSEKLILKKGACVMFVKNNFNEGYANGTLGKVIGFTEKRSLPIVETITNRKIAVKPVDWIIEEDGKIKAKVVQIPLRLAWAITIHKSQGMNLDAAEINLGKSFSKNMGYVALSRVRTLEGLYLKSLNRKAFEVKKELIDLDKKLKKMSEKTLVEYKMFRFFQKLQKEDFNFPQV